MASQLTVFLSSTVEDFEPVRDEIAAKLRTRGIEVRMSERPEFPVEPGMTSHEACLAAIHDSHVFVLLIGSRFGGEYLGQNKSITWREWEEAFNAGLLIVTLVEQRTNERAIEIWRARAELLAEDPTLINVYEADRRLRDGFPDCKPTVQNLPGVQRFIDAVRKGHEDNWVHLWTGTPDDAMRFVNSRCNAALATGQKIRKGIHELAKRERDRTGAIAELMKFFSISVADVRSGISTPVKAVQNILDTCSAPKLLSALLGFAEGERYNLMVYERSKDDPERLDPGPRAAHEEIVRHHRSWRVGEGHVGLAVKENAILVSGDLRETAAWTTRAETDEQDRRNYVSAIGVPLYLGGNPKYADGVFIVTSSRLDHFKDPGQPDALTAAAVGRMLEVAYGISLPVGVANATS